MQSEHSTLLNQLSSVAYRQSSWSQSVMPALIQCILSLLAATHLLQLLLEPILPPGSSISYSCTGCHSFVAAPVGTHPSPWFLDSLLLLHWSRASCLSWLQLIKLQLPWEPILPHGSSLPPTPVCVYIIVVCYKIRYRTDTDWNETTFCGCPCTLALWRPHYVLPVTMLYFGNPSVPVVPCSPPPSCECFSYCCVLDTR